MNRLTLTAASVVVFAGGLGLAAQTPAKRSAAPQSAAPAQPKPAMAVAHTPAAPPAEAQTALVKQYCAGCHSDKGKAGGLSLASFDAAQADQTRRGRREDDPQAARRHDAAARRAAPRRRRAAGASSTALETRIDTAAALQPEPGLAAVPAAEPRRVRARGAATCSTSTSTSTRSCRPTRSARGFDNIADVQSVLADAAGRLPARGEPRSAGSRSAIATRARRRVDLQGAAHRSRRCAHVEGAPFGTRGGISVVHTFPADGDYTFRVMLHGDAGRRAVRQRREPQRAARDLDQRRARRAARHRLRG